MRVTRRAGRYASKKRRGEGRGGREAAGNDATG